ncbi:hypothetical protein SAY87_026638 [Trapa incisa]|uniref:Uncharacterized protein n=1 Tax=Trapa incisa TaxID=236973 RepID=A0AAN7H1J4_9MYRT|nr:hypothetical protein SAY87_026638 [Trapa incisa]
MGLGYYEGESTRPPVVPDVDHKRASLLESMGHFRGGVDIEKAINWLHNMRRSMDSLRMHYLDRLLVATRLLSSKAREWSRRVRFGRIYDQAPHE